MKISRMTVQRRMKVMKVIREKKIRKLLEVRSRARREAARRRKSEWTVNLGVRNSSRNNATCRMTPENRTLLADFWTFFSPSKILGGRPSKRYTHFITPRSRHVA